MLTILAILLCLAPQQPPRDAVPPSPAAVAGGVIAGRVTVADSKPVAPVRRARVTVTGGALRQPEVVDTDADGRFSVSSLAPGSYRVTVSKPGFVTLEAGATRYGQRAAPVAVAGGKTTTVTVTLPRGAAVEGVIRTEAGDPAPDVLVSAVRFTHTSSNPRAIVIKEARTDDRGRYRLHSLPEGTVFVQATPDPRIAEQYSLVLPGERGVGLARTFFPGTAQVHEARAISLQAGRDVPGTDFTIAAVPLARVAGRILDSTGKPAPGNILGVRLRPVSGLPLGIGGIMLETGFQMSSVPPGDYWLMATIQASPTATTEFAAQRLTVAGQDLTDLTITTAPGAVLEGRIEADGGALPPLKGVRLAPVSIDYELPPARTPTPPVIPGPDGAVKVNGIFGPKLIRLTGLPAGWALKAVTVDGKDVTDVPTDFRAGNGPRLLLIVVTDKTGSVSGTVWSGERQASSYQVVLFPGDERTWREGSRFVTVASPQPDGSFTAAGLLPGEYFVAAVPVLDDGAASDPDVLGKLRASATRITVAEGAHPPLKLQLQVSR